MKNGYIVDEFLQKNNLGLGVSFTNDSNFKYTQLDKVTWRYSIGWREMFQQVCVNTIYDHNNERMTTILSHCSNLPRKQRKPNWTAGNNVFGWNMFDIMYKEYLAVV